MGETFIAPEKIQERGLEMLKFVDEVCRRENLTYWLSGGTLLGAVRHKGFIPWDDDVDLMMPRPDYEKLVAAAERLSTERYILAHPRLQDDYAMSWMRVYDLGTQVRLSKVISLGPGNLFVDIFPVDALPTNKLLSDLHFRRARLRYILLKSSRRTGVWPNERLKLLKKILTRITHLVPSNRYARRLDRFCNRGDFNKARYAGCCVITHYGNRERMPKSIYESTVRLPFCDGKFPAPVGWDTYLRNLYGDYMQLPPENQRVSQHYLRATIIDGEGE